MKLYFENFKQAYKEFLALSELVTAILSSMGIILRGLTDSRANRKTSGMKSNKFTEWDDEENSEEEVQMDDDGVHSSLVGPDVLTMQNLDDSTSGSPRQNERSAKKRNEAPYESRQMGIDIAEGTDGKNLR